MEPTRENASSAPSIGPVVHGGAIHNVCPVDLTPLPALAVTAPEAVRGIVDKARLAQRGWANRSFDERVRVLTRAAKNVLDRRHEALALMREEVGKLEVDALMSEVLGPLDQVSSWASVVGPALERKKVSLNPINFPKKSAHVDRVARGVIGIIAPWNYPVATLFRTLIPALLCGNAVVLKPSEYASRVERWFAERMSEELPPDLVAVILGDRAAGVAMIEGGVDAVVFTGSVNAGRDVARRCGELLIPCSVELGGKDAAIVLEDCDLDRTVAGLTHWTLHNVGQACGAVEIAYVDARIADALVDRLARAWRKLKVGDGAPGDVDLSPLTNARQLALVEQQVEDAKKRGAKLVCGGKRLTDASGKPKGYFYEPTLLDHCTSDMEAVKDETFGPVLAVVRVDGAADAIRRINKGRYGLTASIWTRDHARATRLADQIEVGVVTINNHAVTGAMASLPWSGWRETGTGVANSELALSTFLRPRAVLLDRNTDPELYWMPYDKTLWELGNLLADAQLMRLGGAWKIPFLIKKRLDTVRDFFKG
jgi:acyl-CoA reductase-like NAD-dependent aldehyde dehydrogenase